MVFDTEAKFATARGFGAVRLGQQTLAKPARFVGVDQTGQALRSRTLRPARQRSEQYFTSSHTFSHFLRQVNGLPQVRQVFSGRSDFFTPFGILQVQRQLRAWRAAVAGGAVVDKMRAGAAGMARDDAGGRVGKAGGFARAPDRFARQTRG